VFLIAGLLLLAAWYVRRSPESPPEPVARTDPWADYISPYRNVRSGIAYVGDDACARCHETQAKTYLQHPMGRDLAPVANAALLERYGKEVHNPFEALGFQFRAERRGPQMFHHISFQDPNGKVIIQHQQEVQFVIGSGTRTYSYLVNHDGALSESPITWFPQSQVWDLSPGFGRSYLGGRPVREECLFCHCSHAEHVPGSENRYAPPIFTGFAIGCERCHGPGELHVQRMEDHPLQPGEVDETIVNPGRLDPVLREAVCQQCHLEGSNRILRRGRQPFGFRPSLPLHRHLSVFVPAPGYRQPDQFVGQVEQMHESRCFKASQGKLGCISCHDPHRVPSPAERVGFFRSRCLTCHKVESCAASLTTRRQTDKEDSCIRCHMPRHGTGDIPHTAVTDHRIVRRPEQAQPPPAAEFQMGGMPLASFYGDFAGPDDPEVARDLGIALGELAWASPRLRRQAGDLAVPLLEEAVRRWPNDAPAWEAKGKTLWLLDRRLEGLADLIHALTLFPREEGILQAVARMETILGRDDSALAHWQEVVAINSWNTLAHINLATLWSHRRDWSHVETECQAVFRFDPFDADIRILYIEALLHTGRKETARAELDKVLSLQPSRKTELRQKFAELER
jgi:Flp pilus assembly protein TadD